MEDTHPDAGRWEECPGWEWHQWHQLPSSLHSLSPLCLLLSPQPEPNNKWRSARMIIQEKKTYKVIQINYFTPGILFSNSRMLWIYDTKYKKVLKCVYPSTHRLAKPGRIRSLCQGNGGAASLSRRTKLVPTLSCYLAVELQVTKHTCNIHLLLLSWFNTILIEQ